MVDVKKVLLIDDDGRLSAMLVQYLSQYELEVTPVSSLKAGLEAFSKNAFSLVLLDLMLPDGDGLSLIQSHAFKSTPVILLTAKGDLTDRILGLEIGADDYVAKPFEPRELVARIKAVLRRSETLSQSNAILRFGSLEIDKESRGLSLKGKEVFLTGYQFDLLVAMAERAGRVLSREQLLDFLPQAHHDDLPFDRAIDVHIGRIRTVIEDDTKLPKRIITVRGIGYVFTKTQD